MCLTLNKPWGANNGFLRGAANLIQNEKPFGNNLSRVRVGTDLLIFIYLYNCTYSPLGSSSHISNQTMRSKTLCGVVYCAVGAVSSYAVAGTAEKEKECTVEK